MVASSFRIRKACCLLVFFQALWQRKLWAGANLSLRFSSVFKKQQRGRVNKVGFFGFFSLFFSSQWRYCGSRWARCDQKEWELSCKKPWAKLYVVEKSNVMVWVLKSSLLFWSLQSAIFLSRLCSQTFPLPYPLS